MRKYRNTSAIFVISLPREEEIMKCTEKDDARRWSLRLVGDISLATSKDTYRYAEFHIFSVMNQYTYGF